MDDHGPSGGPDPPGRGRSVAWRWARVAVALAGIGLAAWVIVGKRDELIGAAAALEDLNVAWLGVALGLEALAIVAYALMERRLLRAGGARVGTAALTAVTFAGNSLQLSMPGGAAWAYVYAFRQFRRLGADETLSTWALIFATVLSNAAIALVAAVGLVIAQPGQGPADLGLLLAGVAVVAAAIFWLSRNHGVVTGAMVLSVRAGQAVIHKPTGDAHAIVEEVWSRLVAVRPGWRDVLWAAWWALWNWLFDAACLAVAFLAVGAGVPWRGMLLAYGAAQLAALLPVTPGGLGVVEGSLTIALVAYGGSTETTVSAVLLYRLLSFWGMLPVGWACLGALALRQRRAREATATQETDDGVVEVALTRGGP